MAQHKGVRVRDGRVQIHWSHQGQRRFETTDLPPTAAGLRRAARLRQQRIEAAKYGDHQADAPTFAEYAQRWLDTADLKHSTRNDYRNRLNQVWMPHLARVPVSAIRTRELRAIDESIDWPSGKTRSNSLIPLRAVLRQAWQDEWLQENPAERLVGQKRQPADPDPFSREERDTLLRALEGEHMAWCCFALAFDTGLRTGELIGLRWRDWDGEALHVAGGIVRGRREDTTKTYKSRRVLVGGLGKSALGRVGTQDRPDGHILLNQYGRAYSSAHHLLKRWRAAHEVAGVRERTGPYPWRHTYASLRLSAGAPVAWVAAQLGNSPTMCERVYARWIPQSDDRRWLES